MQPAVSQHTFQSEKQIKTANNHNSILYLAKLKVAILFQLHAWSLIYLTLKVWWVKHRMYTLIFSFICVCVDLTFSPATYKH